MLGELQAALERGMRGGRMPEEKSASLVLWLQCQGRGRVVGWERDGW